MKIASVVILVVLIFLAISSGIVKIALLPQEVEFFGKYGFTDPMLMAYGTTQLIGGILLVFKKTRFIGAITVAATFLISLVVLLTEGNIPVSIATIIATVLLGVVAKQSWKIASSGL